MKKLLLVLVAGAFMSASMMSCSECVDCSGAIGGGSTGKICKKDYEATGANATVPWSTYKAALKASGCK